MWIPVTSCAAIVDTFLGSKIQLTLDLFIMFNFFQVMYVYLVQLCADNNMSCVATIQFWCSYRLFTFACFCLQKVHHCISESLLQDLFRLQLIISSPVICTPPNCFVEGMSHLMNSSQVVVSQPMKPGQVRRRNLI